ncbi:MAG: DNA (cytosine-5-)-methyltransferase [Bacteroidaceae bacterium]|nr:DNA (cytosine-5-)-methyltransferase [Bacteroidaceae bacterium]
MAKKKITFIDLFAGIGGIRLGLEQAIIKAGYTPKCVFTSEIKEHAILVLKQNHPKDKITGDITKVDASAIPDFDILCAGFPCQAFSAAGKRNGFADTRGTLFFDVERIVIEKKPKGFILENVEGLVNHDGGNTLDVIVSNLNAANYWVSYNVLNSVDFGVPQERKRIYIIGIRKDLCETPISLENFPKTQKKLGKILETGKPTSDSPFVRLLLEKFTIEELSGKAIKDKRGGDANIHSWDLELKGPVTDEEKHFLNLLLTERRKKKWADIIGIKWMDGMPLTKEQIEEFYQNDNLQEILNDLTAKGYVRYEHPKKQITEKHIAPNGIEVTTTKRISDTTKPKGYNIVAGKLSYEVGKILSPKEVAPTLVATDMQHLYVIDNGGLRTLTLREGLRLFGYPESFKFEIDNASGFDLLGNTVVVPVIKAVASRLINEII